MGLKLTNDESERIVRLAFVVWIEKTERQVRKCIEYRTRISGKVRLRYHSVKLVKDSSRKVLGKSRASKLSKPQIDRLRDDLELHGRRTMEAFMAMREPWVVSLARLLKNARD